MNRYLVVVAGILTAVAVAAGAPVRRADGTITGTVKVTGAASGADVVVYVEQASGTFTPPAKPITMDQRQMQFVPKVLPVLAGTMLKYLNSDPTPHNVFTPDNEKFNLGTWPQGQSKDHAFATCAKFPCVYTMLCRVHPEMLGYVVVLQNPYFGASGKAGEYKIENVPAGTYTLAVWHARAKAQPRSVMVEAGKAITVDFTLSR